MCKLEQTIIYIISPILLASIFYMMTINNALFGILYIPIFISVTLLIYGELFILPVHSSAIQKKYIVIVFLMSISNFIIGILSKGEVYHIFNLLVLFLVMRKSGIKKAVYLTCVYLGGLLIISFFKTETGHDYFVYLLKWMVIYIAAACGMMLIRYMLEQNKALIEVREKLIQKNLDLEDAYFQLKRAYDQIEEYTIMKERSYMSREMHDTVGHTLTTTLVELEVCRLQAKGNKELEDRLNHISSQVRKGLSDLRVTVKKLKEELDWENEIYALGERLRNYTDIKVKYQVSELKGIPIPVLRCTYRIIQEGITNGIKHGKATAFMIAVDAKEGLLDIEVIDNGVGAIAFKQGFGLTAMTERVEDLKGSITFESYKDEGFTIHAQIPYTIE